MITSTDHNTEAQSDLNIRFKRVFVSYSRSNKQIVKCIVHALRAAGLDVFWDEDIRGGDVWQDTLKTELYTCDLLIVVIGSQGLSGWVGSEIGVALNRFNDKSRQDAFRILPILLDQTPRSVLPPFLSLHNATNLTDSSNANAGDRLVAELRQFDFISDFSIEPGVCPYPGLGHYSKELAPYFYGRQQDLYELLDMYGQKPRGKVRRWLQITGNSGVGKSSILHAGVLPALRNGWIDFNDGQRSFFILDPIRPGEHPVAALAATLVRSGYVKGLSDKPVRSDEICARLMDSETALCDLFAEIPDLDGKTFPLLPIDQFEELFTQSIKHSAELKQFDCLISNALTENQYPLYVASTMRSDFSEHFNQLPRLSSLRGNSAHKELAPVTKEGLRSIIEDPARRTGLSFEDGLADEILSKAQFEPGCLPLTNNLLFHLYRRQINNKLSWDAYNDLHGLGGALAQSAGNLLKTFDDKQNKAAINILLALVEHASDGRHTRRSITRERAWGSAQIAETEADKIINALAGEVVEADTIAPARLVNIDYAGDSTSDAVGYSSAVQKESDTNAEPSNTSRSLNKSLANPNDKIDLIHETLLRKDQIGNAHFPELYEAIEDSDFLSRRTALESRARAWVQDNSLSLLSQSDYQLYDIYHAGADSDTREYLRQSTNALNEESVKARRKTVVIIASIVLMLMVQVLWLGGWGQLSDWYKQYTFASKAEKQHASSGASLPKLVSLSGGSFLQGSSSDIAETDEQPVRLVELARFFISESEITFDQYASYLINSGKNLTSELPRNAGFGFDDRPVINVTWYDASSYAEWLSTQLNQHKEVLQCSLPTESEWEYAARAGTESEWHWGDSFDDALEFAVVHDTETKPVKSKRTNQNKLYDMAGNVWEWTQDCYKNSYKNARTDGSALETENCSARVLRGGSFLSFQYFLRSSFRDRHNPIVRSSGIGFRVVCRPY